MTPKLVACLVIALMTGLAGQSQDRRTLQISETDTILLNPTFIEYVVSIGTSPHFPIMDVSQGKKGASGSEEPASSMATVKTLLRSHQIMWGASQEKGYTIGRSAMMGDSSITITVHTEVELKAVYALLSPLSGITASIGKIDYEPMPDRVSIYKTLYQRALAQATGMAAISGKTLGELISVEEPQDLLWSMSKMMDGMEPTVNFIAELSGHQRLPLQKKEEVKILFKFELK
jgi:hypothetical protein